MAVKPVEITILTDADQAVRGFKDVERAAEGATTRFADAAERTDNLDSKAAAATGSLGALSSGFELVGLEKYAAGLQGAAMATDFFSGVGQGLTLILESQTIKKIKDTAATIANTTATIASSVASKTAAAAARTWAIAQRALNLALISNPIGLVVVAVAALVAGIILAYNKSETFRNIVQAVGKVGQQAFGWIVDRIQDVIEIAGKVIGWFRDRIPGALETLGNAAQRIGDVILAPFRLLQDIIEKIIDLIGKIPSPGGGIPFVDGIRAVAGGSVTIFTTAGPDDFSPPPPPPPPEFRLVLTSELVSALERGRQIAVDLKAYADAGGTVTVVTG